ncbi:RdgB/HAM1 family non-canonical purine NTP pyrophosphatase [Endozoicomonas sp. G2_1]|uniref:RdgB/HAM1 family non-canonical purine NTP pyrophosphatase n=1 Tax=Endozoicomonas sp. G2_1 TaxID=2821091 RepID=UPI001ADADAEE|nr:RdgB/HAM1 family non-canonical purine NTP pyrophosphatase [Endozoicomonas sp. G2_1]MBO9489140.1 RdgB/HAM1 family non-canonical purine NTP pyrophosphatase [Endozoicomonas sp. G2_1]
MSKIVLATGNQGKVKELSALLADYQVNGNPVSVIPQSDFDVPEVPETGTTFVENAIIKARHAAKITGLPAIADDSGLEVDALNGAPGIYSSRYAGADATDSDNNSKLLDALEHVEHAKRTARFQCVLVFMRHADDPTPLIVQGTWQGSITREAAGEQGFGYDPLFWQDDLQQTSAELPRDIKNARSHRGQALAALIPQLIERLANSASGTVEQAPIDKK